MEIKIGVVAGGQVIKEPTVIEAADVFEAADIVINEIAEWDEPPERLKVFAEDVETLNKKATWGDPSYFNFWSDAMELSSEWEPCVITGRMGYCTPG